MTSKTTKRALLNSCIALMLCFSMLLGTTYAWFTDTATSSVNTIQAGTLDVVLEYKDANGNWANAEGMDLDFIKAAGAPANEKILWEPGCTYELPAIRVRNNGNLALKYQIVINGVTGNAKLLEAIDFTANGNAITNFIGHLDTNGAVSETIVIKGHMKEEAGNEYQGLTLEGIGITVYATQYAYENDSFGNEYDELGDGQYMNGTFAAGPINSGRTMANNGRYQIAADITKVSGVKTLAVNVLDQTGKLMTTITPESYQIPTDGKIGSLTVAAVVVGDSSSWQNTAFVPSMSSVPTTMELVVNGAVIGVTEVKPRENANPVTWAEIVKAYYAANDITVIVSAEDFLALSAKAFTGNNGNAEEYTIAIDADIDLKGADFSAMIAQRGDTLNILGNGHTISNANVVSGAGDNTTGQASIFYCFPNSTLNVSNLTLKNIKVTAEDNDSGYAAAALGYCEGTAVLNNVDVVNATVNGAKSSGMLVGHLSGSLTATDCDVDGSVTLFESNSEPNGHYAGKLIGTLAGSATLEDVSYDVTVGGKLKAGNIGDIYGRSTSAGTITVDGVNV